MRRSYSVSELKQDASSEDKTGGTAMSELQATLEFSVELNRFYNVDLFQRGYYEIHTVLRTLPKSPARIEISDNKINAAREGSPANAQEFRQTALGKTRKFQILYRNEEVDISELFVYRVHTLVESSKLEKNLENLDLRLELELWCNDDDESSDSESKMECASSRTLQFHLQPTKGLHYSIPVIFDYFHLSAIDVTVHAMVIAIHQPYLTMPKAQKGSKPPDHSTLEAVYFGQKANATSSSSSGNTNTRFQQAHLMHKTICNILLSAHESLQENLQLFASMIPNNRLRFEKKDCHTRLGETVMKIQGIMEEDDLIQTAITDITQLCAENVILWAQYLEVVLRQPKIHLHLAREHHNLRVRRFAEAFFTADHNKSSCLSCYDPGIHGHSSLTQLVRNSAYFNNIPPLPIECTDLDGDNSTLPVIYEDIYQDIRTTIPSLTMQKAYPQTAADSCAAPSSMGSPRQRSSSNSSSSLSQASDRNSSPGMRKRSSKKKFIKNMKPEGFKRPSSYYCNEADGATSKGESMPQLIGYKKVPVADAVPAPAAVLLGTLSPDSPEHSTGVNLANQLSTSSNISSLSSILPIACISRDSQESIPDQCKENASQTSTPALVEPPHQQTHLPPDSSSKPESTSTPTPTSLTDSPSETSTLKGEQNEGSTLTSPKSESLGDVSKLSKNSPKEVAEVISDTPSSADKNLDKPVESNECSSSKDTNFLQDSVKPVMTKEDYEKVAQDISDAIGEKNDTGSSSIVSAINSMNDDDFSDDDTNVANGYVDDVLETYNKDFVRKNSSLGKPLSSVSPDSVLSNKAGNSSGTAEPKNLDSALGSEISSQEDASHSPSYSLSSTSSQNKEGMDCSMTGSDGSTTAKEEVIADPKQKMTVIEMLKEEYRSPEQRSQRAVEESPSQGSTVRESGLLASQRASSDSDILKNCEDLGPKLQTSSMETSIGSSSDKSEKRKSLLSTSSSYPELSNALRADKPRLVSVVGHSTVNFVHLRENLKLQMNFPGYLYSECSTLASTIPYFLVPENIDEAGFGMHLIVCVHGLDGNSADLRLVRTYIEMALPGFRLEFLMSERNQQDTFADFEKMTDKLVDEVLMYLDNFGIHVSRISFVGHSLGNIIIRSALSRPKMTHLIPKLYTFLSLSGPHLGTLYNTSGLVNMGMWFMQKWKKSGSLLQLSLKDHSDPRQTFLYQLSQKPVLQYFKQVLLVGSHQDRYVPYHSSRIEICKSAQRDNSIMGAVYREMVQNILEPVIQSPICTLIRYDVFHSLPSTANTMIGRAAHIAVLDSEIFIEKFLTVCGLKYFK